jgi:Fe-S cluster assembly scaffold protein SufB
VDSGLNTMGLDGCFSYDMAKNSKVDVFMLWDCSSDRRLRENYHLSESAILRVLFLIIKSKDAHLKYLPHVQHIGSHCLSHIMIRTLLLGESQTLLSGKLGLKSGASASAHYHNHNMILEGSPILIAEPQLEIDFDDVQCTHGVTLGRLDEESIFYMQSRGLAPHDARVMILKAFLLKDEHPALKTFALLIESCLNRLFL